MASPTLYVAITILIATCSGHAINGKLDLLDDQHHKPVGLIERAHFIVKQKAFSDEKNSNGEEKIQVVCSSEGCNKTQTHNSGDSLTADVVVEVKTALNANEVKIKSKVDDDDEEVPDVPVLVGYAGVNPERPRVIPPDNDILLNPRPIVVEDFEKNFPHVRTGGDAFIPTFNIGVEVKPKGTYPNSYRFYYGDRRPPTHYGWGVQQRPTWSNPAPWYRRPAPPPPTPPTNTWTTCSCHPNSVWQPTSATPPYVDFNHPGRQINDKLAPLI